MMYFDNAATTKPSNGAIAKAEKFNNELFYNPSALYKGGLNALKEIKESKNFILESMGAMPNDFEVVFTSCGSESDNLAVFGCVKRGVFVTDKGEHSAIYKSFCEIKQRGETVNLIDLNENGSVNEEKLYNYVATNKVDFVSTVHVNNETGAINDINKIASTIKKINPKIIFHSDGVQAYGKIPYVISKDVDLYSISAHKINGLKGNGALIKKKNISLSPIIFGGGQESGYRSGTENVFGIKVFEYAARERYDNIKENYSEITKFNNYIKENLDESLFKIISSGNTSPYVLSVSAVGLRGEVIMHALEQFDIVVGNGSACSSKTRYSRVLSACGYNNDILDGVIRISFSPENNLDEVKILTEKLNETAKHLKGII